MEILSDLFDVNFNFPVKLQLFISGFFIVLSLILFIQIRSVVNKLNNRTPFYWYIGLIIINLANIAFTFYHYNMRSGTFLGKMGKVGQTGNIGPRGDFTKCTTCDETITLDIHRRYDVLQQIYIDGIVGEVRRPFTRYGFSSLGDMVITKESTPNRKRSYVVSGPKVKKPIDYYLILKIPIVKGKVDNPVYIWRPVPPKDYEALGDLITDNNEKPPLNACGCLPKSCLRPIDSGVGYSSWKFLYQNMRPGKENDYIFCSFWDTPLNTFYCNFPDFQESTSNQTFHNNNLYYNIVGGNPLFVKFNNVTNRHEPTKRYKNKFTNLFKSIISPVNLQGQRQNIGGTGLLVSLDANVSAELTNLYAAIQHYFPGGYNYQVSVNGQGDIMGGARLNDIQKKIIKYAQVWVVPGKSMYVIHNKCLTKERISVERKEIIMRIRRIYQDLKVLMHKYAEHSDELVDYLHQHFSRLNKEMRHIPDFQQKVAEHDLTHLGLNRLKSLERELKNIHQGIMTLTGAVPPVRRNIILNLVTALKLYDNTKLTLDKTLLENTCKNSDIKDMAAEFNTTWDKIRLLYLTDDQYRLKLKNRQFDSYSDSKLEKTTTLLNDLSNEITEFIHSKCQ